MRVLVACEFSGRVRRAFSKLGHDAWSCDLLPADDASPRHLRQDVSPLIGPGRWDLMVAFPPCTHIAASGARWWKGKQQEQKDALEFVQMLLDAPVDRIAIENPVGRISTAIRKPDQIVQPWWFGHGETKATCLWLKGLPELVPTDIVSGRVARIHRMPQSADRSRLRSITYQGVADAMASQWGSYDS